MNKRYLSIFQSSSVLNRLLWIPLTCAMWRIIQDFREFLLIWQHFIVSYRLMSSLKQWKIRKFQVGFVTKSYEIISTLPIKHSRMQKEPSPYGTVIRELKIFLLHYRLKLWAPFSHFTSPTAPNCCSLDILAEPPPGQPIRADIVFIHGLHGSLGNTWRQGLWENYHKAEQFVKPSQLPIRPLKRVRHSRNMTAGPPKKSKRSSYTFEDNQLHCAIDYCTDSTEELDDDLNSKTIVSSINFSNNDNHKSQRCNEAMSSSTHSTFHLHVNEKNCLVQSDMVECYKLGNNLNNHRKVTFHESNYSKCWPADWLPLDCPGVRIIAINYSTDPHLWRPFWKKKEPRTNLIQRAREMTELLLKYHVGCGHPIVYVGHSKGGLFIKQIIVDAWESGNTGTTPLWRSTRGVFFYSVPHRGSNLASIKAPFMIRSVELVDIEKDNKYLLDLHRRFVGLYLGGLLNMEVFSFVETALTFMSFLYLRIVGVDSADPDIGDVCGIRLDHREICKPRNRNCILYKELVKMIKKVY